MRIVAPSCEGPVGSTVSSCDGVAGGGDAPRDGDGLGARNGNGAVDATTVGDPVGSVGPTDCATAITGTNTAGSDTRTARFIESRLRERGAKHLSTHPWIFAQLVERRRCDTD